MNTDIRISVSFKGHRKRKKLRRILGDKSDSYLIDFWITVSTDCPNGILKGWNNDDIADACCWEGDPSKIVKAFIDSGWIDVDDDGVYSVHDWDKHQAWACNAEKRSEAARVAARKRWDKKDAVIMQGACGAHKDSNAPLPIPSSPTLPPSLPSPKDKEHSCEFENFWDAFGKKKDHKKCLAKWKLLTHKEKVDIFQCVSSYVKSTPDPQFRKNPLTWLNGKCWNDEIIYNLNPAEKRLQSNIETSKEWINGQQR